MYESDAVRQRVSRGVVRDLRQVRCQIALLDLHKLVRFSLRRGKGDDIERRQFGVFSSGNKHDGGLRSPTVIGDGAVRRSRHGLHARLEIDDVDALKVNLQRYRSNARGKVEQTVR